MIQLVVIASMVVCSVSSAEKENFRFRGDIYQITDVVVDRKFHTVLPKRCILHIPVGMESKVGVAPRGKLILFNNFYQRNQNWMHKIELSYEEVNGLVPMNQDKMNRLSKLGKMIVAVHKGHPISVKEYKKLEIVEVIK